MKKVINILSIVFFLFLGSTMVQAQGLAVPVDRSETVAKEMISLIQEKIELSGDQQRALFRAYVKREVGLRKYAGDNSPEVIQQKEKLNTDLEKAVKKELTTEQFSQWKNMFLKIEH